MDSLKQETKENISLLSTDSFCLKPDRSTCSYLTDNFCSEASFIISQKQIEDLVARQQCRLFTATTAFYLSKVGLEKFDFPRKSEFFRTLICEKCIWARK